MQSESGESYEPRGHITYQLELDFNLQTYPTTQRTHQSLMRHLIIQFEYLANRIVESETQLTVGTLGTITSVFGPAYIGNYESVVGIRNIRL